eukprot:5220419-Pyramimonas_sp.AAC.1
MRHVPGLSPLRKQLHAFRAARITRRCRFFRKQQLPRVEKSCPVISTPAPRSCRVDPLRPGPGISPAARQTSTLS